MSVDYISFSAHTDYEQTSEFIRALRPPHIVLVHGEANEMNRLKAALTREYENDAVKMNIYNPKNTVAVELYFRGEKMAKVMGSLATEKPSTKSSRISGILVKRNFNYHLVAPSDLNKYTDLTMSTVTQKQSISYSGSFDLLNHMLTQLAKETKVRNRTINVFNAIDVSHEKNLVTIEWVASPVNDMYADAVLTAVLQADSVEVHPNDFPKSDVDDEHFKECVIDTLQDMFGRDCMPKTFKGDSVSVEVDGKTATINFKTLDVTCEDEPFQQIVQLAVTRLHQSLTPLKAE